jgi:hypothetical protein
MEATFEEFSYGSGREATIRKEKTTALLFIFYAKSTPKYFKSDVVRGHACYRGVG